MVRFYRQDILDKCKLEPYHLRLYVEGIECLPKRI
jgi:hypothetical protein